MLKVHANVITRILKDLAARQLVEHHKLSPKKKTYRPTKKGDLARQVLDNLLQPKTLSDLVKYSRAHHNVITAIIKGLVKSGFVTLFKTIKPAKKFYQLTTKGEAIREKLE